MQTFYYLGLFQKTNIYSKIQLFNNNTMMINYFKYSTENGIETMETQ